MKTLTFLLLSTLLLTSLAQDCNNPLLATFNLDGLDEPVSGAGLPFCQDLQAGQTCCSVETVAQFQTLVNNLQAALLNTSGVRDQNVASLRTNLLSNYDNAVDQLSDFDGDITNLQSINSTIGDEVRNELNVFDDITNRLDNIDSDDEFAATLADYQRKRVTCLNTLLEVQASAWCLACNPNYASLGVSDDGSITFSQDLNNAIVNACLPFTVSGTAFTALFQADQSSDRVQNLITYMQAFRDGGNTVPNLTISDDINVSTDPTQRTNTVPAGCDGSVCAFQTDNLFVNGVLNQSIAANGAGVIGGEDINLGTIGVLIPPVNNGTEEEEEINNETETIPGEEEINTETEEEVPVVVNNGTNVTVVDNTTTVVDNSTRLLQAETTWNPNIAQTGVQLNVIADPGNVSGLQGDGTPGQNGNPSDSDEVNNGLSSVRVVASGLTMIAFLIGALIV